MPVPPPPSADEHGTHGWQQDKGIREERTDHAHRDGHRSSKDENNQVIEPFSWDAYGKGEGEMAFL